MTAILDTPITAEPPAEDDDRIVCHGCGDDRPRREIRDRAGYPLCATCRDVRDRAADRRTTRTLAYAH